MKSEDNLDRDGFGCDEAADGDAAWAPCFEWPELQKISQYTRTQCRVPLGALKNYQARPVGGRSAALGVLHAWAFGGVRYWQNDFCQTFNNMTGGRGGARVPLPPLLPEPRIGFGHRWPGPLSLCGASPPHDAASDFWGPPRAVVVVVFT